MIRRRAVQGFRDVSLNYKHSARHGNNVDIWHQEVVWAASTGRGANFTIGRCKIVVAGLRVITRVRPSCPGCRDVTRARGHFARGSFWSVISTRDPSLISFEGWCHLEIERCRCRHSVDHRAQKYWSRCWMNCHRSNRETGISNREGSGIVVRGSPIKKCPGVKADKSSGSSERGERGRELNTASICMRRVLRSSNVRLRSPMVLWRLNFTDLTSASHLPPKWGAPGGLNCQDVPSDARSWDIRL